MAPFRRRGAASRAVMAGTPPPLRFHVPPDTPDLPRPQGPVVFLAVDDPVAAWSADTAVALARSWASDGAPVRLVDLSVWTPLLHERLGVTPERGATDVVVVGTPVAEVVIAVEEGLELVPAGTRVWDPARVLCDARLADVLAPPPGGLTLALLPLDLPGSDDALRRADATVLLAPAHAEPGYLMPEGARPPLAWWGPADSATPAAPVPEETARRDEDEAKDGTEPAATPEEPVPVEATARDHDKAEDGTEPETTPDEPVPAEAAARDDDEAEDVARPAPGPGPRADESLPGRRRGDHPPPPAPGPEDRGGERATPPGGPESVAGRRMEPYPDAAPRPRVPEVSSGEAAPPPPRTAPPAAPAAAPAAAPGVAAADGVEPVILEPRVDVPPDGAGVVAPPRSRKRGGAKERRRWTILLAEDNDDHALLVQMSLRWASQRQVALYRARNGQEAIDLLESVTPDLLLLDLKMPGRTGHEVLDHVKGTESLRRIPVAVLTSSDRDEDVERAYGLGGNHFLTKPDDPRKLQRQLRTLLDNLGDLSSIRRGRGAMEATGVTAIDPPAVAVERALRVALVVAVLAILAVLAWRVGLLS